MWLEIKTDLMWVVGGWWVVGVEGENRNKLGACQYISKYVITLSVRYSQMGEMSTQV